LNKAVTNTTLTGGVTVDVYQDRLRFFEQGGSARGFYLDISAGGSAASTKILGATGHTGPTGSIGPAGPTGATGPAGTGGSDFSELLLIGA